MKVNSKCVRLYVHRAEVVEVLHMCTGGRFCRGNCKADPSKAYWVIGRDKPASWDTRKKVSRHADV
jgi:hypothetical protein